MAEFTLYNADTAPEAAKAILEGATAKYGFTPNLLGVLAESPVALKAYTTISGTFGETSFDGTEQQVVLMATSFINNCTYCMAAHSTVSQMTGVPADVVESLRSGTDIADPKLNALATFVRSVVEHRGAVDTATTDAFLAAGYTKEQAFEVLVGIAQKTMSNFTNSIADTPKDEAFVPQAWTKPTA